MSVSFNVSQYVRDCWLAGLDEWHMIDALSKAKAMPDGLRLNDELTGHCKRLYHGLDMQYELAMAHSGIPIRG